jgi:hypothetical protein
MGQRGRRLVIGAVIVALFAGCGNAVAKAPADANHQLPPSVVFDRPYLVLSVSDRSGGEPFEADRLAMAFAWNPEPTNPYGYSLGYTLQCNLFGAEVKVTPLRVWVKVTFQSELGCSEEGEREDEWLATFLEADPYWIVGRRGRLILTAPQGILELRPGKRKGALF